MVPNKPNSSSRDRGLGQTCGATPARRPITFAPRRPTRRNKPNSRRGRMGRGVEDAERHVLYKQTQFAPEQSGQMCETKPTRPGPWKGASTVEKRSYNGRGRPPARVKQSQLAPASRTDRAKQSQFTRVPRTGRRGAGHVSEAAPGTSCTNKANLGPSARDT